MVSEIRIYIEGIGDSDETAPLPSARPGFRSRIRSGKETTAGLRPGFRKFFQELFDIADSKGIKITSILCGSRRDAYEDFKMALESHPDAFNILLVDSESPVCETDTPWEHLRKRKEDQPWILDSVDLDEACCHLMVQTMEAWFIADIDALTAFYEEGFREEKIQRGMEQYQSVEQVSKDTIDVWLKAATRHTSKGKYKKAIHAPEILKLLNVARVRQASPNCDRLFTTLTQIMAETTPSS